MEQTTSADKQSQAPGRRPPPPPALNVDIPTSPSGSPSRSVRSCATPARSLVATPAHAVVSHKDAPSTPKTPKPPTYPRTPAKRVTQALPTPRSIRRPESPSVAVQGLAAQCAGPPLSATYSKAAPPRTPSGSRRPSDPARIYRSNRARSPSPASSGIHSRPQSRQEQDQRVPDMNSLEAKVHASYQSDRLVWVWADLFSKVDTNADGYIDKQEFATAVKGCWFETDLDDFFARLDANKDGLLDHLEFATFCEDMRGFMGALEFEQMQNLIIENAASSRPVLMHLLHTVIPPDHRGFELGGRTKNVITKVYGTSSGKVLLDSSEAVKSKVVLERGWRAVACDYRRCEGSTILETIMASQKACEPICVTFQVKPETFHKLGGRVARRNCAFFQLKEKLGHKSYEEIAQMSAEEKGSVMQDEQMRRLIVDATAVEELELLLETKTAEEIELAVKLRNLAAVENPAAIERLLKDPGAGAALEQRDASGNVVLHHASDLESARLLIKASPDSRYKTNIDKQRPLHSYVARKPKDIGVSGVFVTDDAEWLEPDESGVMPSMLTEGPLRKSIEGILCSWEDMEAILLGDVDRMQSALSDLYPRNMWKQLLHFHCFGEAEVWKEGQHTRRSKQRLKVVFRATISALSSIEAHDHLDSDDSHNADGKQGGPYEVLQLTRQLLLATKGPRHKDLDPRQPYREELVIRLIDFGKRSKQRLASSHNHLKLDPSNSWLLDMESGIPRQYISDIWRILEIDPMLLMRLQPPPWIEEMNMKQMYEDLQRVGMIGATEQNDSGYEFLLLAGTPMEQIVEEGDVLLANWYAAFVRGVHQQIRHQVYVPIQEAFAYLADRPGAFYARSEAKGLPRVCEKVLEAVHEIVTEMRLCPQPLAERKRQILKALIRSAVHLICDIHGCTYIAETMEELGEAYEKIMASGLRVARIKNGFARNLQTDYRDLKLWLDIECEGLWFMVELQLHLRALYNEKKWMHLPYEFFRGSLDWKHCANKMKSDIEETKKSLSQELQAIIDGSVGDASIEEMFAVITRARCYELPEEEISKAEQILNHARVKARLAECGDFTDFELLRVAVKEAKELGVETAETIQARRIIMQVDAQLALETAIRGRNLDLMSKALDQAGVAGFRRRSLEEAKVVFEMLTDIVQNHEEDAVTKVTKMERIIGKMDAVRNVRLAAQSGQRFKRFVQMVRSVGVREQDILDAEELMVKTESANKTSPPSRSPEALRRMISERREAEADDVEDRVELMPESTAREITLWVQKLTEQQDHTSPIESQAEAQSEH